MIPDKRIVLDKGWVKFVGATFNFDDLGTSFDYIEGQETYITTLPEDMTVDAAIARAARISYGEGTARKRSDAGLIDYLVRHRHTSPLEQVSFQFSIKAPLFVVQQFLRHRTAKVNQESARYSILGQDYYVPKTWRKQDTVNRQGSDGELPEDSNLAAWSFYEYEQAMSHAFMTYKMLLNAGVARELARMVLPSSTYTKLVWQMDLHNLLHFLNLRLDPHAQWEIRQYAEAIHELIKPLAPLTLKAWENHVRGSLTFSVDELEMMQLSLNGDMFAESSMSDSRKQELLAKLQSMMKVQEG